MARLCSAEHIRLMKRGGLSGPWTFALGTSEVLLITALLETFQDMSTGKEEQRPQLTGCSKGSTGTLGQLTSPSGHRSSLATWSQM